MDRLDDPRVGFGDEHVDERRLVGGKLQTFAIHEYADEIDPEGARGRIERVDHPLEIGRLEEGGWEHAVTTGRGYRSRQGGIPHGAGHRGALDRQPATDELGESRG